MGDIDVHVLRGMQVYNLRGKNELDKYLNIAIMTMSSFSRIILNIIHQKYFGI